VPGYLATLAYSAIGLIYVAMVVLLGWILARVGAGEPTPPAPTGLRTHRVRQGIREEVPA
jgi:hypothetical protein